MTLCRLLPVVLVLLQGGLTAARAHTHRYPHAHPDTPHVHLCELLALVAPAHDHEEDGDEHDSIAFDLTDLMTSGTPPAPEAAPIDLAPVGETLVVAVSARASAFPLGLPPSTAGPHRPLYLTFCTLTI